MNSTLTPKEAFEDICSMPDLCQLIVEGGSDTTGLSVFLQENNYFNSPKRSVPTLKSLGTQLKVQPHTLRKWILAFYAKLLELVNENFTLDLKWTVEYQLVNRKRYMSFCVEGHPSLPRIGESVEVSYFRKYMGTTYYYVKNISHEMEKGEHRIIVELHGGFYNLYWHMRKDEASAKRELSINELCMSDDYDLMSKLRISDYWSRVDDSRREFQNNKRRPRRKSL